nr:MAG TPA: hypothetical protein [Caudoviricetes sp.]
MIVSESFLNKSGISTPKASAISASLSTLNLFLAIACEKDTGCIPNLSAN